MSMFYQYLKNELENQCDTILENIPLLDDCIEKYISENLVIINNLPGLDGGSEIKIEVYNNEGQYIPHFHIKNKRGFSCCVEIFSCNYFVHANHTGTLNNKQAKALDQILRLQLKVKPNIPPRTVWQEIVRIWNKFPEDLGYNPNVDEETNKKNMSKYSLPTADEQPNYSNLNS